MIAAQFHTMLGTATLVATAIGAAFEARYRMRLRAKERHPSNG